MGFFDTLNLFSETKKAGGQGLEISDPLPRRRGQIKGASRQGIHPQTLVLIRWIAVAGQISAVLMVELILGYHLPFIACLAAISALALSNLLIGFNKPRRWRLSEGQATRILAFDLVQLSVLTYLTGGLANPFSLLLLVPGIVSAAILTKLSTILLGALALGLATLLAFYHQPLPWPDPGFNLPVTYLLGIWTALAVAVTFTVTYVWSLADEARQTAKALEASAAALARAQQMSALGGIAAAAAHELGTPLSTIYVVASELSKQVDANTAIGEDVALLKSQVERCRDILITLEKQPEPDHIASEARIPLSFAVEEVAEEHMRQEKKWIMRIEEGAEGAEPQVLRQPEFLHGLGNIIQNAAQFAENAVVASLTWDDVYVRITIRDDGPGFPSRVLEQVGEPYISTRAGHGDHMGLGVFIAYTLLEKTGAQLQFDNRKPPQKGARVTAIWYREDLEAL